MSLSATILHLQRLSTEDGPGIRTTVFFKGCSLRCAWCHNPESISPQPQAHWLENRCIGCQTCIKTCPIGAISWTDSGPAIDRARCDGCGACAEACPGNAMERLGTEANLEALVKELLKDRAYFDKSGGGVTASGGEPTLQAGFTAALFKRLQAAGVSTALDTCGLCSREALERILPFTDLALFDLKLMDPGQHQRFTGMDNRIILENLLFTRDMLASAPHQALWIRTPLIPGATATMENLTAIGAWIAQNLGEALQRWELCAFNNLCRDKYRRLELDWPFADTPLLTQAELAECETWAKSSGPPSERIFATGATRP